MFQLRNKKILTFIYFWDTIKFQAVLILIVGISPMSQNETKKGIYTEYLDTGLNFNELTNQRKIQLKKISELREDRAVLVLAADINKGHKAPISITYSDLVPFNDQLSVLDGDKIDLIIETPGGLGEVAEDMVRLLRSRFNEIGIIVPGYAKSAGTLLAMAGDEILMEEASALGPIDAQINHQGKQFSAEAFIKGLEKIKDEVEQTGLLNKAYIPILQAISPGEIQHAENALKFAKILVTDWLANYKFKNWDTHSSTGKPVTAEDRSQRAQEIADKLAEHSKWLTHARSIKIQDLRDMKLLITDYCEQPDLADAIRRYFVLLQMTFAAPQGVYKIFETPYSQIMSFEAQQQLLLPNQMQAPNPQNAETVDVNHNCAQCHTPLKVQANLDLPRPLKKGRIPFPTNNLLNCPKCGNKIDLSNARLQIEKLTKRRIVH